MSAFLPETILNWLPDAIQLFYLVATGFFIRGVKLLNSPGKVMALPEIKPLNFPKAIKLPVNVRAPINTLSPMEINPVYPNSAGAHNMRTLVQQPSAREKGLSFENTRIDSGTQH